jgi:glycosyltransferase involved in cell wall biosynthesis
MAKTPPNKAAPTRIIVTASTFPASPTDTVPAFVRDQIIAMHAVDSAIEFHVLAPHVRGKTVSHTAHKAFYEHRFHYAWPRRLETLTAQGILPALKQQPLFYLLVPFLFLAEFVALLRLTYKLKPAYLYAHWFTPQAVVASWVSWFTKVPFVYTTHAADVDVWHRIPGLGRLAVQHTSAKAAAITAVSPRSLAKLERFFTPPQWRRIAPKTRVIPMGTNLTLPQTAKTQSLKKTYDLVGKKVLFFMGRLAEKKGVSYLLNAFENLNDTNTVLVIAGDGPLRATLEQQASKLPVAAHIRFVGYLSGQAKSDYLQLADVVVLPSIITDDGDAEGLPVVFMEALAAGKITVATNESGADTIITHGESGLLLPHKDTKALTKTLQQALSLDSSAQKHMQSEARRIAQQFDWPTIAKQHLDFLFPKR